MTLKLNGTNSVATPAYAGDDADTGLQCGTDELKLVTGGTARVTVSSNYATFSSNIKQGPANTTDQYQGIILQNGKDSSAAANISFIDFRNNEGTPDCHFFAVHQTDGSSDIQIATTAAGSRTTDRRAERIRINGSGAVAFSDFTNMKNTYGVITFRGFAGKAGQNDPSPGNVINFNWSGASLQAWVDTTNVGNVSLTSDYRAKQNITSITANCIDRIKQLRPVQYEFANYKNLFVADGVTREGFIAHEVADVIPSGANGAKDDPDQVQSLQPDAILSVTVKALQEAIAKIETLETKVAALEAAA